MELNFYINELYKEYIKFESELIVNILEKKVYTLFYVTKNNKNF